MSTERRRFGDLPRVFVTDGGGQPTRSSAVLGVGALLRDIDLIAVVERSANRDAVQAIDLDSVRGLTPDEAAVDFVLDTLGIGIVMSRRPAIAARASARGGLGLLHALAFDSTGLGRSLGPEPLPEGIGTVISPGPVLCHMRPSEIERLPRPILAYGLLTTAAEAMACLDLAEGVIVRQDVADALAATLGHPGRNSLTTIAVGE